MSRSLKKGINYFSVDVEMFSDRKVKRLMRSCGAAAVAVLVKLWCGAYDENGYYITADGDLYFDIASELGETEEYISEVVGKSLEAGLFDRGMYERFGILTSRRMQSNYANATRKRANSNIAPEYLLLTGSEPALIGEQGSDTNSIDPSETSGNLPVTDGNPAGSSGILPSTDGNPGESSVQSTQSKVKHIKAQQIKAEESTPKQGALARSYSGRAKLSSSGCSLVMGNVKMTEDEYAALCSEFGESGTKRMIEMLGNYKASKGKTYANDYYAILSWVVKRWREEQGERASFERATSNYDYLAVDPFAEEHSEGSSGKDSILSNQLRGAAP